MEHRNLYTTVRGWERKQDVLDARYQNAANWLTAHPDVELPLGLADEDLLPWLECQMHKAEPEPADGLGPIIDPHDPNLRTG